MYVCLGHVNMRLINHRHILVLITVMSLLLVPSISMVGDFNKPLALDDKNYSGSIIHPGFQTGSIFSSSTVTSGGGHNCAITESSSMLCWGLNGEGQLGNITAQAFELTPVEVDFSSIVTSSNLGAIYAVSSSVGSYHSCAVMNNGNLSCWGANSYGQLGIGSTVSSPPTLVDLGAGRVAIEIAAGDTHTCAITDIASVMCWGYNNHGQLGDGTTNSSSSPVNVNLGTNVDAVAISTGESHTCVITSNQKIMCWGYNNHGQLGDGTFISTNSPVVSTTGVPLAISTGLHHTCVLFTNDSLGCWGWNDRGQLGDGTQTSRPTSISINLISNSSSSYISGIITGDKHTCAMISNGTMMCWGDNLHGQLGINSNTMATTPQQTLINSVDNVIAITAGGSHTCAAIDNGALRCWGDNLHGQLGDGTNITKRIPTPTLLLGETITLSDRDIDEDSILNIFDTHILNDEDGDGVPTPSDAFPNNPVRSVSCDAGQYGRYSCEPSPAGFFAPLAGAILSTPCYTGTYQNASNQTSCIDSDPGYYVGTIGAISQIQCVIGTYQPLSGQQQCDDASPGHYVDSVESTNQTECGVGEYQPFSAQSSCIGATPGYYVDLNASSSQTPCLAGTYNPNSNSNSSSACLLADLGNYVSQQGRSSQTLATSGHYVDVVGATSQTPCSAGSYNPEAGSNNSSACLLADLGNYVSQQGRGFQTLATPGYYVDVVGATSQTPCSVGTYNPGAGSNNSSACLLADLGYYVNQQGRSSQTPASSGYYVDVVGATSQTPCLAGTYNPNSASENNSACLVADLGYYVSQQGRSSQTSASSGYYVDVVGATSQTPCLAGTYNPNSASENNSACLVADLGYYVSQQGRSSQTPASPGNYVDVVGATSQSSCLPGTFNPSTASTTANDCQNADPGNFVQNHGMGYQTTCEAGTYQPTFGQTACVETSPGHFSTGTGNSEQTPCSAGNHTTEYRASLCNLVPQGTYSSGTGTVHPIPCPSGTSTVSLGSKTVNDCIVDTDFDGVPDLVDLDDDGDGVNDDLDAFPRDSTEHLDTDDDGEGNNADMDDDGDGVSDNDDLFPLDFTEQADFDGDQIGDNADTDDDGDGWADSIEFTCGSESRNVTSVPIDFDGDGICDVMDTDDDGDNVPDLSDKCLGHDDRLDWDNDGIPDGCDDDLDMDGDGVNNGMDLCDYTPADQISLIDGNGCAPQEGLDDDNDGVLNSHDLCLDTPINEQTNPTGCGASERDSDEDGWTDARESDCDSDPLDGNSTPNSSHACFIVNTDDTDKSSSIFGQMSCFIIPILLIILLLVVLTLLAGKRNKDSHKEINISINKNLIIEKSTSKPSTSDEDDWDEDDIYGGDVAITNAAETKIAEMDAKMVEMDAKMAELSEKEQQLARIAEKADTIDFATIGVAYAADSNDLEQISGIGPFIVEKLNALGIFTFKQIANMTPEIEDQVNKAIEFFPGRVKRDDWVGQAGGLFAALNDVKDE